MSQEVRLCERLTDSRQGCYFTSLLPSLLPRDVFFVGKVETTAPGRRLSYEH